MRRAHFIILAITFTLVSLWIARNPIFGVFDSLVHWGAVRVFVQGGDPYDQHAVRQFLAEMIKDVPESQRMGGHPWSLTFMIPFYAWPFPISKFLLAFANLSIYYLCIHRLRSLWPPLPRFAHLLMWGYIPFLTTLYFGQFSIFLLLGSVLVIEWLHHVDRPWWKWAVAMALLAIKPQGFIVAAPFLALEFVRTSTVSDRIRAIGFFAFLAILSSPVLVYLPGWITSNHILLTLRTSTLSVHARDIGALFGYDTPLWLWVLPVASLVTLLALGVRITGGMSFLLVLLLSQLTAPYIWVYDSSALMPLFYALLGAIMAMPKARWRRYVGIIFTSVSVFPIYLAIDSDFGFMRMHNVCLAIAALALLPGLRKYFEAKT